MPAEGAVLFEEDRARAAFYALIARLFHAGPDAPLLAALAGADDIAGAGETAPLAAAWKALGAAAAVMDAAAARDEYDSVFIGTGKAEVTPYVSHYLAEAMQERVLVQLRDDLAAMELGKIPAVAEYEDHLSCLCEVMRHLVAAGSDDAAVQQQKDFFFKYLFPCYAELCAAVSTSPNTTFYRRVADFTKAFLDVESDSFEMI